ACRRSDRRNPPAAAPAWRQARRDKTHWSAPNRRRGSRNGRAWSGSRLPFLSQQAAAFAIPAALALGLALVVQFLAAGERDLDFGAPLLVEVELERDDGHTLALDGAGEATDLALMQQQLARPFRRMIEAARLQVFGNVGIDQPDFATARVGVGLADRGLAVAQRLHLGAGQHNAGLEGFTDLVIETRPAVVGDNLEAALLFGGHHSSLFRPFLPRRARRRQHGAARKICAINTLDGYPETHLKRPGGAP